MTTAGYVLTGDAKQIARFNSEVMKKAGLHLGIVVHPTSSQRGFISAGIYKQVQTELGDAALGKLHKSTGLSILAPVDEAEALALIKTRDPADLGPKPHMEQRPVKANGLMLDWHLVEAKFPDAWDALGGIGNIQWGDAVVGHIDTGFTLHPALGFDANGASAWIDTARDWNFFSKEFPLDSSPSFALSDSAEETAIGGFNGGHGTRTLSVLCGFDESVAAKSGGYAGYFGAAPQLQVIPIRIEDTVWIQDAMDDDLPEAIEYLVQQGVCAITLSMGSPKWIATTASAPRRLRDAIDTAYEKGVVLCCAAGNHVPNEKVVFPARCPRTLAVGGSTPGYKPWAGSSYGVEVDISAPAFPIRRADAVHDFKKGIRFSYGVGDGTSFATPQVAAAAALWRVRHGTNIDDRYAQGWQKVEAFRRLAVETATPGEDWNGKLHGPGVLNADALLKAALPDPSVLKKDESQLWN